MTEPSMRRKLGRAIDITGERFGRLVVVSRAKIGGDSAAAWDCICDCGGRKVVRGGCLRAGSTRSCGCLQAENKPPRRIARPLVRPCETCGDPVTYKPSEAADGKGRFCSMQCFAVARAALVSAPDRIAARFWKKVDKGGPVRVDGSRCWVWTAGGSTCGYGSMYVRGHGHTPATHVSWFLKHGEWPALWMLHRCDNPPCVNPEHLFEGTIADNNRDAVAKGRHACGEATNATPYDPAFVLAARAAVESGKQLKSIAKRMGCSETFVSNIKYGKTWRHVLEKAGYSCPRRIRKLNRSSRITVYEVPDLVVGNGRANGEEKA